MPKKRRHSKPTSTGPGSRQRRRHQRHNLTRLWIGVGIVVLIAAAFLLINSNLSLPTEVPVGQAYEKYQQGAFFLDVRAQDEWDQVHIPKSVSVPLDDLLIHMGQLPRDQDIIVVCKSGVRSKGAVTLLRQADFSRATCMRGGIEAWIAAGHPVEY